MAIVAGTGGMTQAQYDAEVARKNAAGIALTGATNMNNYKPPAASPTGVAAKPSVPTVGAVPAFNPSSIATGQSNLVGAAVGMAAGVPQPPRVSSNITSAPKASPLPTGGYVPQFSSDSIMNVHGRDSLSQDINSQDQRAIEERKRLFDNFEAQKNLQASRSNRLIQENRSMEDYQLENTLNPFNGRTSYAKGLTGRERALQDSERATDLDTSIAQERSELDAYLKATPDRRRELLNDAIRNERGWALDLAGVTGNLPDGGGRTLAGQAQDFNQGMANKEFALNESSVTGTYNGQQTQQAKQLERANFESDRSYNFAVGQQEWDNNFKSGQFDFQKAQQIWDNTFQDKNFQQSMNEAAQSRGLQWASLKQRDQEFIADQEFKEEQFKYQKLLDETEVSLRARELEGKSSTNKVDSKTSTDNYDLLLEDVDSGIDKVTARTLLQANRDNLSDSDYTRMSKYIEDNL